jgi:hypothetical protein
MTAVILIVIALSALAFAAVQFGRDSRDGRPNWR